MRLVISACSRENLADEPAVTVDGCGSLITVGLGGLSEAETYNQYHNQSTVISLSFQFSQVNTILHITVELRTVYSRHFTF